jgi:DNA-binding transcriptional ArsR family regulator
LSIFVTQSLEPNEALAIVQRGTFATEGNESAVGGLVVAPWLSRRTQQILTSGGINYLDSTGNAQLRCSDPVFYFQMIGSQRNPSPVKQAISRVRGPKATRLLRCLANVQPPYSVTELAQATSLSPGYISRLLEALERDAIVTRAHRGRVIDVEVRELLRYWAESSEVFSVNAVERYIAPRGPRDLLIDLASSTIGQPLSLTGSFAAVRIAPVAAPSLLLAYCDDASEIAQQFGLLPAERGADVVLLEPFDASVFAYSSIEGDLNFADLAQVAVDCLTGNGRMPAEGEALLSWMLDHEDDWRSPSIGEHLSRTLRP